MIRLKPFFFIRGLLAALLVVTIQEALALAGNLRQPQTQTVTPTLQPTPTYVPGPVPDSLFVERRVDPSVLRPGQEATVYLRLQGRESEACWGVPGRPVDAMLVFDISTSAGMGPGSNWEQTVSLTQALLDHLSRPIYRSATATLERSRMGLVGSQTGMMGPEPVLQQALTDDYALLRTQVSTMTPGGDTDIAAGLRLAVEELARVHDDRAEAILLMLHDNTALDESTEAAVGEVQAQGIPVYLVVNSRNIADEKQITLSLATQLVAAERVFLDLEPATLRELFIWLTEGNATSAGAYLRLVETFDPPDQMELLAVYGPGGRIEGGQVLWELPVLEQGETLELSYRLRLRADAGDRVSIAGGMTWLDCNGYPHSTVAGALVEVTPGPTNTPVVIEIPKLTPAAPATPTLTPAPTPTETGTGIVVPPGRPGDWWRRWPWWLLLLPLLLLALAMLIWWLLRRRGRPAKPAPGRVERPPDRERGPGIPPKRSLPTGVGILEDWVTERVTDRQGRLLALRLRSAPQEVQRAIQAGANVTIHFRVDEGDREIGRALLTLEAVEQFNPLTGDTDRWYRACLGVPTVEQRGRQRGIESLILKRAEVLARQYGAREIYGASDEEAWPFFEQQGYQVRQEGRVVFKSLTE